MCWHIGEFEQSRLPGAKIVVGEGEGDAERREALGQFAQLGDVGNGRFVDLDDNAELRRLRTQAFERGEKNRTEGLLRMGVDE